MLMKLGFSLPLLESRCFFFSFAYSWTFSEKNSFVVL